MKQITKRDGTVVPFLKQKIESAVFKALDATGVPSDSLAAKVAGDVVKELETTGREITSVEEVQDYVEMALMRRNLTAAAKAYILYRDEHTRARNELKVKASRGDKQSVTDAVMLIDDGRSVWKGWDRATLRQMLEDAGEKPENAAAYAKEVEDKLIAVGIKYVTVGLVREMANTVLLEHGAGIQLADDCFKVPVSLVDDLMATKSNENSNIVANNPEAVNLAISELVLKNYALRCIFSEDVARAHATGMVYIHDLGYPTRVYCGSHSIEYIKKYGLKGLNNLNSTSKPAKTASVLTGHINTFLASMQSCYAGALGLGFVNVFYAPLLEGLTNKEIHQVAQELVFNASQNAFSRGSQSLHPTELIWTRRDGVYRNVEIGPFVDAFIDGNTEVVRRDGEYEIVRTDNLDLQTISFDRASGAVVNKQIRYVARMPHKGKMYRVHTAHGIVNVTGNHSLFEFKGKGDIRPVKVKDMKPGAFVVVPHGVDFRECQDSIDILSVLPEKDLACNDADDFVQCARAKFAGGLDKGMRGIGANRYLLKGAAKVGKLRLDVARRLIDRPDMSLSLCGDSQAVLPRTLQLSRNLGYVAGMYVAEGMNQHKHVNITNGDPGLLDKVARNLDSMGYKWYRIQDSKDYSGRRLVGHVEVSGILGYFLQSTCSEAGRKIVPGWVIDANEDCVDGFIEGFYDGESSSRKAFFKDGTPEWSVSNTQPKVISGMSLLLLRKKRECYVYEMPRKQATWNTCYELREAHRRRVNPFSAYTTVDGYARYRSKLPKDTQEAVDWLVESDLSVSIIKKIEEYDYDGYVYDISVPGTEAFLGGIGSVFFKNTLFIDVNVHSGVPGYLRSVPAIGRGGQYMFQLAGSCIRQPLHETMCGGDWCLALPDGTLALREHCGEQEQLVPDKGRVLTYGDFEPLVREFAMALLDIWYDGDANGRIFEFPKCDFHVSAETFTDPEQRKVYERACELAAHNGSTYFVFDREAVTLSSCCFTGDTKVLTKGGVGGGVHLTTFKELAEATHSAMRTNLTVFHNGGWSMAKLVKVSGKGKKIYEIRTVNNKVQKVTEDHLVPTFDGDKPASEVTEDDYLLFNNERLDEPRSNSVSKNSKLSFAQGVLIGAYLGDGSMDERNGKPQIHFSLNKDKYDQLMAYLQQAAREWDVDGEFTLHNPYNNVYPLYIASWGLRDRIRDWVSGDYCYEKAVNVNAIRETADFRSGIVWGLYWTDGGNSNRIYTTSQAQVETMEALFTSLGIPTSIDVADRTGDGQVVIRGQAYNRNYPLYCIRWYESRNRRQYSGLYRHRNNSVYFKVASVNELPEEETVYCFEITDDNEPYFTLPNGIITHNCRLKTVVTDMSLLRHPERLRSLGFQNVTVNVPQAAYRAASYTGTTDLGHVLDEIDKAMDIAVEAHLQKKAFIEKIIEKPGRPLWQLGKPSNDGSPYIDLKSAMYIIGVIGVNDAVKYICGKEMHESPEAMDMGLEIAGHMFLRAKEYTKKYGLQFKIEESPAESAARKLAKADLRYWRDDALQVYKGGDEDHAYYTNSIHLAAEAPVSLLERIDAQAKFNPIIEAGAITHAFIGEQQPDPRAIASLIESAFLRTQSAQITFSPEFTYCEACGHNSRGLHTTCPKCGSDKVFGETRIVGYFSRINNFNLSKLAELRAREHGRYAVENLK